MSTNPTDTNAVVPAQTFSPEPAVATPVEAGTPATSVTEDAFGTAQETTGETTGETTAEPTSTSEGTLGTVEESPEPGFIARHTTTLITLMVAVIVAAAAIAGVVLYRNHLDKANADTATAFAASVAQQGATLETVECHGDTCAAVINGQAYTVLVQEDGKGKQHFGVSAYSGG
jgi:hypothetical protein